MKILIDADGSPVIDLTIKIAKEFNIEVFIFCDTSHIIEREGVHTQIVSKGRDAVDFVLVNKVQRGDIVVTQDYGLAAMVLSRQGNALNQHGMIFSENNMDQLLFTRHLSKEVRNQGGHIKGPRKRKKEDDCHFEAGLRKIIQNS